METINTSNVGFPNEVLGWVIAVVLLFYGFQHLKRVLGYLFMKLYEYFIGHSY